MVNRDDIDKWIDTSCDDGWDPAKDGWDLESDEDEIAPPLIPNELKRVHEELAVWRSPADFRQATDNLMKRCRQRHFPKPASQVSARRMDIGQICWAQTCGSGSTSGGIR